MPRRCQPFHGAWVLGSLLLAAWRSEAAEPVLEWRLRPGTALEVINERRQTAVSSGADDSEEHEVTHGVRVWTTWVAGDLENEGAIPIRASIDRIRIREEIPGCEPLEYDFTGSVNGDKPPSGSRYDGLIRLVGLRGRFRLTTRGLVQGFVLEDVESMAKTKDRKEADDLQAHARSWFLAFPPLPPDLIAEGGSWDYEFEPLPWAMLHQRNTCSYLGVKEEDGREMHVIRTSGQFSPAVPENAAESFTVETIESKGEARFDANLHRMVRSTELSKLSLLGSRGRGTLQLELGATLREKDVASESKPEETWSRGDRVRRIRQRTQRGRALLQRMHLDESRELMDGVVEECRRLVASSLSSRDRLDAEECLASSLTARAASGVQSHESVVPLYEQAAGIYRELINEHGRTECEQDLASTLKNLGYALTSLRYGKDRPERAAEALQHFSAAIEIYRRLPGTRTGEEYFLHELIDVLESRARELSLSGAHAEAAEDHAERIDMYRELIVAKGRNRLERDLAQALLGRAQELAMGLDYERTLEDLNATIAITNRLEENEKRRIGNRVQIRIRTTSIDLPARLLRAWALIALREYDKAVVDLDSVELHQPLESWDGMVEKCVKEAGALKDYLCENQLLPPGAPRKERSVESWLEQLEENDREKRLEALGALSELEDQIKVRAFAAASRKKDPFVQEFAIRMLGRMGPRARAAIPALIEAVKEGNFDAVETLRRLGPDAREALPALETLREAYRGTTGEERLTEVIESLRKGSS